MSRAAVCNQCVNSFSKPAGEEAVERAVVDSHSDLVRRHRQLVAPAVCAHSTPPHHTTLTRETKRVGVGHMMMVRLLNSTRSTSLLSRLSVCSTTRTASADRPRLLPTPQHPPSQRIQAPEASLRARGQSVQAGLRKARRPGGNGLDSVVAWLLKVQPRAASRRALRALGLIPVLEVLAADDVVLPPLRTTAEIRPATARVTVTAQGAERSATHDMAC